MKRALLFVLALAPLAPLAGCAADPRRAYEELGQALGPPVQLMCSTHRRDIDAIGCFGACTTKRAAEDARTLTRAAHALAVVPAFKGGNEKTKRLLAEMRTQASALETRFKDACASAEDQACADKRTEAQTLKTEADLEDLLSKIAQASDRPQDMAFPDPTRCSGR